MSPTRNRPRGGHPAAGGFQCNHAKYSPPRGAWASGTMTTGIVLDLRHAGTSPLLSEMQARKLLRSRDALGVIRLARDTRYRYVIWAGQLHRPGSGVFSGLTDDANVIGAAMLAAHERMGELEARYTTWVLSADDNVKARLTALLADAQQTEGTA